MSKRSAIRRIQAAPSVSRKARKDGSMIAATAWPDVGLGSTRRAPRPRLVQACTAANSVPTSSSPAAAASVPTWTGPKPAGDSPATMRWLRAPGWMPRGRRVYVIGDIHGCKDKLVALRQAIAPAAGTYCAGAGSRLAAGPGFLAVGIVDCFGEAAVLGFSR